MPALTAAYELAIIGGGIALLLLGNKVIGPALLRKGLSEQSLDCHSDLIGVTLFSEYFIVL